MNTQAILIFAGFVLVTLGITYWASLRTRSSADFYTAGGGITGTQNGLAIVGDYMSAATLLGISSLAFSNGFDSLIYAVCAFMGWPIVMFLIAERLRNLGRYTLSDIVSYRLDERSTRIFTAISSLTVVLFYLIVQMVGAGQLVQLLFGIDYAYAVIAVGLLMMVYVVLGGMVATTWVQIIKAVLMLGNGVLMAVLALGYFDFDFSALVAAASERHPAGEAMKGPWKLMADPFSGFSLALSLVFGIAGLPHIMMRFFTVPDARAARKSVFVATGLMGVFFVLICFLGLSAMAILPDYPAFYVDGKVGGPVLGGSNMPIMHLATALGGNLLFGLLAAVSFATILAVVSGLTLAGASAAAHDLYAKVLRRGNVSAAQAMRVNRLASIGIGLVAIVLGLLFRDQNVAFLVALAFSIAASANFPVLLMSMYWRGLTTRGALAGGLAGLSMALALVILSPAVWVRIFGFPAAVFPYDYPTLISMPLAFLTIVAVSAADRSRRAAQDRAGFPAQEARAETAVGIAAASH
ncbi:sodium/solute symporter [Alcaligenes sp. WGS1538]|uniref:sodium:solute symporter family transporter n=1 Tax=Alcaligenes sp. WGS1538 TaxID=3366811 RepID=UPI00372D77E0